MGALHSVDVGHAWGTVSGGESMAFTMNQEQEKYGGLSCVSFCGAVHGHTSKDGSSSEPLKDVQGCLWSLVVT